MQKIVYCLFQSVSSANRSIVSHERALIYHGRAAGSSNVVMHWKAITKLHRWGQQKYAWKVPFPIFSRFHGRRHCSEKGSPHRKKFQTRNGWSPPLNVKSFFICLKHLNAYELNRFILLFPKRIGKSVLNVEHVLLHRQRFLHRTLHTPNGIW